MIGLFCFVLAVPGLPTQVEGFDLRLENAVLLSTSVDCLAAQGLQWVASGSPTMIACSLSSWYRWVFHQSCRVSHHHPARKPSCVGTEPAFRWLLGVRKSHPRGGAIADRTRSWRVLIRRNERRKSALGGGATHSRANCSKLGFDGRAESRASAKYIVKRPGGRQAPGGGRDLSLHKPRRQTLPAMDFVRCSNHSVFELLYAFVVVRLDRRDLHLASNVNSKSNGPEWVWPRQIIEAFPWG